MAGVNDERRSKRSVPTKIAVGQVPKRNYTMVVRAPGLGGGQSVPRGFAADGHFSNLSALFPSSLSQQFSRHGAQLLGMLAQVGKQPLLLLLASAWRLPVDF